MGFYTGKDVKKDDIINFPEIVVPLLFREWGEHREGYSDGVLWDRYIWEGSVVDLETYVETDLEMSRAGFIPGVGCTVNSIMDMHNIISTHGSEVRLVIVSLLCRLVTWQWKMIDCLLLLLLLC